MSNSDEKVLVTGASGFLGIYCVQRLLEEGYTVKGSVRNINDPIKIPPIRALNRGNEVELVEADLEDADSWTRAVEGCQYVLHVASPCDLFTDESIIATAVNGTLNVIRAAYNAKSVKKVVITSSTSAINHGYNLLRRKYDEDDWTKVDGKPLLNYTKGKAQAEKAAWDFVATHPDCSFTMTALNPVVIVGPLLQQAGSASVGFIARFLDGSAPAYPKMKLGFVDVRDVADAHVRALHQPSTDGNRIILCADYLSMGDLARLLSKEFKPLGYRIPRVRAPKLFVKLYGIFDKEAAAIAKMYGFTDDFETSKVKTLLGMELRDPRPAIIEMAYDLTERGIVKKTKRHRRSTQNN